MNNRLTILFLISICNFYAQPSVDFLNLSAQIKLYPSEKKITGKLTYTFKATNTTDTICIDAKNMTVHQVYINNQSVPFINTGKQLKFYNYTLGNNKLTFTYQAQPKQTLYFIETAENGTPNYQIWTQGQGKYTSHWLPSFDDVSEKVIFNLSITFDNSYTVISNGLCKKTSESETEKTWHYQMKKPMSSYLVMLAVGKFYKQVQSCKGIPLEFYLDDNNPEKFQYTYADSQTMFQFLNQTIGITYPWKIYRQLPVKDFLYAGMENTTSTLFSTDFVIDRVGYTDVSYHNVNAHELAHQWFGNLVTAQSSTHHWLQEGFATYYALLAEQEVFGNDYFAFEMLDMAKQLQQASKTDTIPLLNPKASSLTFYKKGAWLLHLIRTKIGSKNFDKAVKRYLKKYRFRTATTSDFFKEIQAITPIDTDYYTQKWLLKSGFDYPEALQTLTKSPSVTQYLQIEEKTDNPEENLPYLHDVIASNAYYKIKEDIVYALTKVPWNSKKEIIQKAMQQNHPKVRQAIAATITQIPNEFKNDYESLLNDPSYTTQEIALLYLWKNFPQDRIRYLDISKNWTGFTNLNLKCVWLALSSITPNYPSDTNYQQLEQYTSAAFESSIRQNAFEACKMINRFSPTVINNLEQATHHHRWQFSKFSKELLAEVRKSQKNM